MIEAKQTLERLGITTDSPLKAVQEVREIVEGDPNPQRRALVIITNLCGVDAMTLSANYQDPRFALHVAQGIAQRALQAGDKFDPAAALRSADESASKLHQNPALQWLFNAPTTTSGSAEPEQTQAVGDVKVAVKKDGTIKKGGKQVLANELYKKHVVGANMSNKDFIQLLMKELDMSKQGATTYSYNCKKAHS